LYDPSLLQFSVDMVHDLDRRFGFAPKHTIFLVSTCTACCAVRLYALDTFLARQFFVDLVHNLDRRFGFAPKHTIFLVSLLSSGTT
jgi:hypothetical protein